MMKKASLAMTNPYIKDPVKRRADIEGSVMSSCAIGGVRFGRVSSIAEADVQETPATPRRPSGSGKRQG